jgi:hypothetical protein
VPGELRRVGDHQIGPPVQRDRCQLGEDRRRRDRAEQLAEPDVGNVLGRQRRHLREPCAELARPGQGGWPRCHRRDPRALDVLDAIGRRGPQDVVSAGSDRARQRHHRVDVSLSRRRRHQDPHDYPPPDFNRAILG